MEWYNVHMGLALLCEGEIKYMNLAGNWYLSLCTLDAWEQFIIQRIILFSDKCN